MQKIRSLVDHIIEVYDLELVTPNIPRNEFQYFKRNFYLFIKNNISERLFYFLRDKISPIKFMLERPSGEIWFRKRFDDNLIEVELVNIPSEASIYVNDSKSSFKPINGDGNYMIRIYSNWIWSSIGKPIEFPVNTTSGIDAYFQDVPHLKQKLREFKLKKILNE